MAPRSRFALLLGALLTTAVPRAEAQERLPARIEACRRALTARFNTAAQSDDPCFELAGALVITLTDELYRNVDVDVAISPRDLQQTNAGGAAGGAGPGPSEAVPTVQPMAIGGGSLAAVGSDAGADAVTALTINPAIFFTTPAQRDATARLSRLTDVTIIFPVDRLDRDADGTVDYFGLRLRVNATGPSAGGKVMQRARALFVGLLQEEAQNAERLAAALKAAPNLDACVTALQEGTASGIQAACGAGAEVRVSAEQYQRFREQVSAAREEADAQYLGLDFRLDFGDPTLGAVPNASATTITAGLAFGRQFVGTVAEAGSVGVKGRVGLRYTDLRDLSQTSLGLDGGLGFSARRPLETLGSVDLTAGFEFRYARAQGLDAESQTNFLALRAALVVPLTGGTDVSVALGVPLMGRDHVSPTLSVSANWDLLLPRVPPP